MQSSNVFDISQRENQYTTESDIFNVFPLEDENFVQSSPALKKQKLDDITIFSTQNIESAVIALKSRQNELANSSIRYSFLIL